MSERPIVHLFCNAHIDPVWMWPWEEGAREAISTFWTAANLLDEFPEFIFNHNESVLYEWVEEYDPPLFARIREYVREGRWNITGGWYLQPDVNLPGGETLVRVILEGRRYFKTKFGVEPPVAYNFDSFGHPGSLPQLLNKSGFALYVHCRPEPDELALPGPIYRWRGVDGSEVLTVRPNAGWYGTPRPGQPQEQARKGIQIARDTGRDVLVTWGLGNHGGGATRHDLNLFREMIAEMRDSDVELRHSTPEAFLTRIMPFKDEYPVHEGELQRTLAGTYTSVASIKRQMREGEALLASAERWASIAWWRYGYPYPAAELREAWWRLMFNTFHDVLCGSLQENAMAGVDDMYGYAHDVARRVIMRTQHAVLPAVSPTEGTIPLYVMNPHSTPMRTHVSCNFLSAYAPPPARQPFNVYDDTGKPVVAQADGGNAVMASGTWQPYVGFVADVPPLTARRYEIRYEEPVAPTAGELSANADEAGITVRNQWWIAKFSQDNAALVELVHRETGRNILQGPVQFVAMKDVAHAWGGSRRPRFNEPYSPLTALSPESVGDYFGMEGESGVPLRILSQGPVAVTVECLVGWQHTRASIQYTFYADLPVIDINTALYMQARRKMLKFVLPFDLSQTRAVCEVPYGTAERPTDATEYSYARWVRLEAADVTVGVANNGQSGFDIAADGTLNLSITRGATHSSWEGENDQTPPPDMSKSYTYMDQHQVNTRFRLLAGVDAAQVAAALIPTALELNQPLETFFTYYPPSAPVGAPATPQAFLQVEPATVQLGALKQAEDGEGLIVRLFESVGVATNAVARLEDSEPQQIAFTPYEIKTFRVSWQGSQLVWTETDLIEA